MKVLVILAIVVTLVIVSVGLIWFFWPSPTLVTVKPVTSTDSTTATTTTQDKTSGTTTVAAQATSTVPAPVTYNQMVNFDHPGDDMNDGRPFATLDGAKAFCDKTVDCKGYNSGGYAKTNVSNPGPSNGITLFTKN